MTLILLRHGIAMDRTVFASKNSNDDERPLTEKGRYRMAKGARGLKFLVSDIDLIVTSPLLRAKQTAEYLYDHYPEAERVECPFIRPESSCNQFIPWVLDKDLDEDSVVCLVGHEPNIGFLAGYLLTGQEASFFEFKKGGACCLNFFSKLQPGQSQLVWHLMPKQLRRIGDQEFKRELNS